MNIQHSHKLPDGPHRASTMPACGPLKVLLVEDNARDARRVEGLLQEAWPDAFAVERTSGCDEAMSRLAGDGADVVLLGLGLADIEGPQAVFEVQGMYPRVPIVVLSGWEAEELALELVEHGAQDYLIKGEMDGTTLGRSIRYAVKRKAAEEALRQVAYFDSLTGLANRILFEDRLEQAISRAERHRQRLAVMFLDLDRFKSINDTLGHEVGDDLLRAVGQRLAGCLRKTDTAGRRGGDEFTLLLEEVNTRHDILTVADKVLHSVAQPFDIGGTEIFTTTSIGVATYPESGESARELVRNADAAMYLAKSDGRNMVRVYTGEMDRRVAARVESEGMLRRALERREFALYYQPQVNLDDGRFTKVEALIRWFPEGRREPVLPSEFIPMAEQSNLILDIGEWVLGAACQQVRRWRGRGVESASVSVNFSARQLEHPGAVDQIERILADSGLPPEALELELTESTLIEDPQSSREIVDELRARRITVSIDDFGTGACSLSYLKHFPVDTLKVDRSFVANIDSTVDGAIASAVIDLARRLGMRVVAEGVETNGQLNALRHLGVDAAQGFLFGRPCAASRVFENPDALIATAA